MARKRPSLSNGPGLVRQYRVEVVRKRQSAKEDQSAPVWLD
ncbi:hypothetical protein RR42_m3992 [Cupriavidus basilensis]|uniref:Uncharacterized protein n=1 Tax=Cupriavidus basilensis TaxID=68895 RepID=A0A0C4Y7E7_9BURK|nr:hypothetical protein RR42_m3992 [Cupriavidus basilensis]